MPDPDLFLAFLFTAVALTLTPGPDNLMVLATGIARGRRAGTAFGLGCAIGCLSHTALAALGVGALIAASPMAFTALRWAGGAYLIWLGIGALRSRGMGVPAGEAKPHPAPTSAAAQFGRGLLANAINPKVVLFFLSFLPQFVDATRADVPQQMLLLGVAFTAQTAVIFATLGWFAGHIGQWLQRRPAIGLWLDRLAGAVFVALGLRMIAQR